MILLNEFDENKDALINPTDLIQRDEGFPEIVVSCFSKITFERLLGLHQSTVIVIVSLANLDIPVYEISFEGKKVALVNAYVGAAGCVGIFEELAAYGMKKLLLFGTCGVLDSKIKESSIILPTSALRDEGTSFHYAPPSKEIAVNQDSLEFLEDYFIKNNISYTKTKVWTTDAFYRETKEKFSRRKEAGCLAVDMECSAMSAFAQFRGISLAYFFYAADNLDAEVWEKRSLSNHHSVNEKDAIAYLALDLAVALFSGDPAPPAALQAPRAVGADKIDQTNGVS